MTEQELKDFLSDRLSKFKIPSTIWTQAGPLERGATGKMFKRKLPALGIEPVISARKSPWQNPYAERVIGSIRRECTDHIIAIGERHLLQTLLRYATYYNESRCHLSLEGDAPKPRPIENGLGEVIATPHLRGLHHRYGRAA